MTTYVVDTSALFKCYVPEHGSERMEALLFQGADVSISSITQVELLSGLQRLCSVHQVIGDEQLEAVWTSFAIDVGSGRLQIVPVSAEIIHESTRLLRSRYITPVDALQLATVRSLGTQAILVSSDQKMNQIAKELGLLVLNPCGECSADQPNSARLPTG